MLKESERASGVKVAGKNIGGPLVLPSSQKIDEEANRLSKKLEKRLTAK